MKNEFHGRPNRWNGFKGKSLITLVLVLSMIISAPFFSNATENKFSQDCSLTVKVNKTGLETGEGTDQGSGDLKDEALQVDLYQIAVVVPNEGSDGYTFEPLEDYEELVINTDMNATDWYNLAQQAAGLVFEIGDADGAQTIRAAKTPDRTGKTGTPIEELDAGLYLLIARSGNDDYAFIKEDGKTFATRAYTSTDSYVFLPELVALPTKKPDENGKINTANEGEWIYNAEAYLKPEKDSGSLRIVKSIDYFYDNGTPITFVFEVEIWVGGEYVDTKEVTIVFDGTSLEEELVIEDLPVGATVIVTEVYGGGCYDMDGSGVETVVITSNPVAPDEVEFKNIYNGSQTVGQVINNHFEYEYSTEEVKQGGWEWIPVEDRSQG